MYEKLREAAEYIKGKLTVHPEVGLILGSGLGVLAEEIEDSVKIPYEEIPNFPVSTVEGHAGQLVIGKLAGKAVIAMQGRFHFYEGYSMDKVVFPVRVMAILGIKKLLVTNAAGGVNLNFKPGTIMLIEDHINLMGTNPLIGPNFNELGPRFPDMSYSYSPELRNLAQEVAKELNIELASGVYVGFTGPSYETPAEIRFSRVIGGDAVGMSTVPEVTVANHAGIEVCGISCITNMAAGVTKEKLSHHEVMETAERVRENFKALVLGFINKLN